VLSEAELESRYHVRIERYIKDMLIEMHTLGEMVDTLVLPAAYSYAGTLASSAAQAKAAGIREIPQVDRANEIGRLAKKLKTQRDAMVKVRNRGEQMHDDPTRAAMLLTHDGADVMAAVRASCDALELLVADDAWPLPKYREMLFPV
jgi:glutamine synthetase